MKKAKTDVLLESLTSFELRSFDRFLKYSLNNKSVHVMEFWNSLYSPSKNSITVSNSKSFSRKTLSDFNKQIEKFFILKNLDSDKFGGTIYLVRELRKRNIEKYFDKLLKDLKKYHHKKFSKGFPNILSMLKLNFEEYMLFNSRIDGDKMNLISKERIKLLDVAVAHAKLFDYYNDIYYSKDNKYKDTGMVSIKEVTGFVGNNSKYFIKYFPNVWYLYLIHKAITNSSSFDLIVEAFDFFKKNEACFTEDFLQLGYDALLKLLFSRLNEGNSRAFEYFYSIVLYMDERGVLKMLHHIPPRIFVGFVMATTNSGNLTLANKIVNEYHEKIIISLREQVLCIAQSMIELVNGNFKFVKAKLENLKTHDSRLYIFSKTTLLKAYYENNEIRKIYPLTDTVKHFAYRRKDISDIQKSLFKFLYYIGKLAQIKKNKGKGFNNIESQLLEENHFFQKEWIVLKHMELKQSFD
ncbi:MAG: hypothetical protein ACOYN6_07245 [Ignavibacteria bacterium]